MEGETYVEFENFDFESNESFLNGWSAISNVIDSKRIGVEYLRAKIFFFTKYCKPIELEKYLSWKKSKCSPCDEMKLPGGQGQDPKSCNLAVHKSTVDNNVESQNNTECTSSSPQNDNKSDLKNDTMGNAYLKSVNNDVSLPTQSDCACDDISTRLHSTSLAQEAKTVQGNVEREIGNVETKKRERELYSEKEEKDNSTSISASHECAVEDGGVPLSLLEIATHVQNGIPIPGLVSVEVHPTNLKPTPSTFPRKPKPWEAGSGSVEGVES